LDWICAGNTPRLPNTKQPMLKVPKQLTNVMQRLGGGWACAFWKSGLIVVVVQAMAQRLGCGKKGGERVVSSDAK
jgi:hypothetical protein